MIEIIVKLSGESEYFKLRSSALRLVHPSGLKIAVDLFSVRRKDNVEAMTVYR